MIVELADEVGNLDFKNQILAANDNFVWMAVYGEVRTQATLFHKTNSDRLVRWVEVKKGGLEGVGLGLFAARKFLEGDMITVYLGREVKDDIESVYPISNTNIVLDYKPFEDGDELLGGHMENDANWSGEEGGRSNSCNARIGQHFEIFAQQTIDSGEEIFLDYNYDAIN